MPKQKNSKTCRTSRTSSGSRAKIKAHQHARRYGVGGTAPMPYGITKTMLRNAKKTLGDTLIGERLHVTHAEAIRAIQQGLRPEPFIRARMIEVA